MVMGTGAISAIITMYLAILAIFVLSGLLSLILRGVALSTIGKKKGLTGTGLAFIPYARLYFQGLVAGEIDLFGKKIKNPGLFILIFNVISGMIMGAVSTIWVYFAVFRLMMIDSSGINTGEVLTQALTVNVIFYIVLFIAIIVCTAIYGIIVLMNYQIYKTLVGKNEAIFHAVLGLFIPLYESICLFALRNREHIEEQAEPPNQDSMWG
jgi:hypothetical protein